MQMKNNSGRRAPNRKVVLLVPYMTINGTNYAKKKKGFTVPQVGGGDRLEEQRQGEGMEYTSPIHAEPQQWGT